MDMIYSDILVVGAGGAGISAAIKAAEASTGIKVNVLSKVYPMRSHTVAAEGGAAAVKRDTDETSFHFADTVSGGDWLSDQDAVNLFVKKAPEALLQLEHWGCPWSRKDDGGVATRAFGGMKIERTWYAADKTGFHLLHTLFQTSLKHENIQYFSEYYVLELLVDDGRCFGAIVLDMARGKIFVFCAGAVILCTGGAGQVFPFTTNAATNTGDGMALAYRAGAALKDMEFVQYHPTALPNAGILITEASRGEGGILTNKDGYRYLQDYELGPPEPFPRKKAMELGPRDKLSQAFWHEQQKGRTVKTAYGDAVHLDIRHLGEAKINERLPMVRELAKSYMGVDPVFAPIPVRPAVHYTMGGISTDIHTKTNIEGLYAAGECACVSINGANRLGSNSLTELLVFGDIAAVSALDGRMSLTSAQQHYAKQGYEQLTARVKRKLTAEGPEQLYNLRRLMHESVEHGLGIYRDAARLQETQQDIAQLKARLPAIALADKGLVFNMELINLFELEAMLDIADVMVASAAERKESRGSHQRLDYVERDDENFLLHTLARQDSETKRAMIDYGPVSITDLPPGKRVYGKDSL